MRVPGAWLQEGNCDRPRVPFCVCDVSEEACTESTLTQC